MGPDIEAGLGAAGLGLATILRGLGLAGLLGGGGIAWRVATTGLGTKSGGGLLNKEPSGWWTLSGIVWGTYPFIENVTAWLVIGNASEHGVEQVWPCAV